MSKEDNLLLKLIIESLNKLEEASKEIKEDINNINITMAKNTNSLEEHMRRSEAAEEALEILKNEMKPVKSFYDGFVFIGKILALLAILATIVGVVFESLSLLMGKV